MKKIILLLALTLITISVNAQEKGVSDLDRKYKASITGETSEQLQSEGFSFASVLFESEYNKNYTDLYFQKSKKNTSKNSFSMYDVEKQPEGYFNTNTQNYNRYYDPSNGFSLGKWNNKKGVVLDISLGGKCGL